MRLDKTLGMKWMSALWNANKYTGSLTSFVVVVYSVNHVWLFFDPMDCSRGLPWWLSGKEFACNAGDTGDMGLIPRLGRSPGGEHGNPHKYSSLENPMDRGAWRPMVHGVTKHLTRLKQISTHAWTAALQAPLSKNFLLQGIFPTQGSNPSSPALEGGFYTLEPTGKP